VPASATVESTRVRHDLSNPKLLTAGIALTLALMAGVELLPLRTLPLMAPGAASGPFLVASDGTQNSPAVKWLNEPQRHLHCRYAVHHDYMGCGLVFVLTPDDDQTRGMDLRRFDSIEVDVSYKGPAPFIRLAIRDFDRRFSKVEDPNSARFHSINLRLRDIDKPMDVDLTELTVAEWWVRNYNLPREYNRPGLENASNVLVEVPVTQPGEDHEMQLRSLTLKGRWVSRDRVYLGILCAWLLGAVAVAVNGWTRLRQAHNLQQREIDALTARTRQLRVEQDKLRRLATIDDLTGVLNRRGLEQSLGDFEEAAQGMTLVLLDIDHFKRVNDRHGHDCGDEVLRRVAATVAANLRASDVFGRWGGEEFLIASQGTRVRDAARLAEKLRERIQASEISVAGHHINVTASFGVSLSPPGAPAAAALKRADEALYRAKAAGRNRVETDKTLQSDAPSTV
jgi:diguanylate cyclase (GGDEF)-like protein